MIPTKRELEVREKIATALDGLDPEVQKRVLQRVSDRYNADQIIGSLRTDVREQQASIDADKERLAALERIGPWSSLSDYRLERNDASRLHKLIEAHKDGKVMDEHGAPLPPEHAPWLTNAQPFVVEHDWAAAFANATDYSEGDFKLPYTECAFEFRISGRTVIVISFQPDAEVLHQFPGITTSTPTLPYVECGGGYWYCGGEKARDVKAMQFVWQQVRAISIALDAEVATREIVRAPTKLNDKRVKDGKVPLFDYHVVRLHGRAVRQQLPSAGGTHRSPRLHFRRGHWRHYPTHKTWIRWNLVGDPSLGFIDKSYRL